MRDWMESKRALLLRATDIQHPHLKDVQWVDFFVYFEKKKEVHILRVRRGHLLAWDPRVQGAQQLPAGLQWVVPRLTIFGAAAAPVPQPVPQAPAPLPGAPGAAPAPAQPVTKWERIEQTAETPLDVAAGQPRAAVSIPLSGANVAHLEGADSASARKRLKVAVGFAAVFEGKGRRGVKQLYADLSAVKQKYPGVWLAAPAAPAAPPVPAAPAPVAGGLAAGAAAAAAAAGPAPVPLANDYQWMDL